MKEQPQILYHYTSLDTLALILTHKTICFNTLLNVDDIEEAETSDLGTFGKYVYVSCWTDEEAESIAMWQMYTPNMHGVRIQLPTFPFKKHSYKAGELYFTTDIISYINFEKLYEENKATIIAEMPKLIPVIYTNDKVLLRPNVKFSNSDKIEYKVNDLGRYKNNVWFFQKEWRYWICMSPFGMKEMETATRDTHMEFMRRLDDQATHLPYERFFLELSDEAISQMKIVFGPRMTEAEKILAKHLLRGYGLENSWKESSLRIR